MDLEDIIPQLRNLAARKWILAATAVMVIVSAAAWFSQQVKYVAAEFGPDEGSPIVDLPAGGEFGSVIAR